MLQKGAWESHSNIQHLLQRAWQHCHATRQNHIRSYCHTIFIFSTRNLIVTLMGGNLWHSWTIKYCFLSFSRLVFTFRCRDTQCFVHGAQFPQVWGWIGQRLPGVWQERFASLFWIRWLVPNCDTQYYIKSMKACVHNLSFSFSGHIPQAYHWCCAFWQHNKHSRWWRQEYFHLDTQEWLIKAASQTGTPSKEIFKDKIKKE